MGWSTLNLEEPTVDAFRKTTEMICLPGQYEKKLCSTRRTVHSTGPGGIPVYPGMSDKTTLLAGRTFVEHLSLSWLLRKLNLKHINIL